MEDLDAHTTIGGPFISAVANDEYTAATYIDYGTYIERPYMGFAILMTHQFLH